MGTELEIGQVHTDAIDTETLRTSWDGECYSMHAVIVRLVDGLEVDRSVATTRLADYQTPIQSAREIKRLREKGCIVPVAEVRA